MSLGTSCDQAIAGRGSGANHAGAGFGHGAGGGKMAGRLIMAVVWTCRTSFAGEDGGGRGVLTEIFVGRRDAVWFAWKAPTLPSPGTGRGEERVVCQAVSGMKVGMVIPTGGV